MIEVNKLHDLTGLSCSIEVLDPVPTLRGPKRLEDDDDLWVRIIIGDCGFEVTMTVEQYIRIKQGKCLQAVAHG